MRTIRVTGSISHQDIQSADGNVSALDLISEQDLHLTNNAQMNQQEPSQRLDARISEERTPLRRDLEPQITHLVVCAELQAIALWTKEQCRPIRLPNQALAW
jgi:hypothetical protein